MTNLDSIIKSKNITLPTMVHLVKAMVFPVVMYGCDSWSIKKAEHQRINAFELWCWRRLLRVPWTARRSNQSTLKNWRRGWQRMRWLDGITNLVTWGWVSSGSWWWTGGLACCSPWGRKVSDTNEWLNWPELLFPIFSIAQFCWTLCETIYCSPQGSSVHGILQARIL